MACCYNSKKNLLLFFFVVLVNLFRHWRKRLLPTTTNSLMKFFKNTFNQKQKIVGKTSYFWEQITTQRHSFLPDLAQNLFCHWRKRFLILFFRHWRKRFFVFAATKKQILQQLFYPDFRTLSTKFHNLLCKKAVLICVNGWNSSCQFHSNIFSFSQELLLHFVDNHFLPLKRTHLLQFMLLAATFPAAY